MKIRGILIKNYKNIRELKIETLENACILIGKNSTGKTVILDAILAACGSKPILPKDFNRVENNIEITMEFQISREDLDIYYREGLVNKYKNYDLFFNDFKTKYPSYDENNGNIQFTYIANKDGAIRYYDGFKKDNPHILKILPKIYNIDHRRDVKEMETDILYTGIREKTLEHLKRNRCMFRQAKQCDACYKCIGVIEKKKVSELTVFEAQKVLEYKMLHLDMDQFMDDLNHCFARNSGLNDLLIHQIKMDVNAFTNLEIIRYNKGEERFESVYDMSEGMKSIYILSLLEAYMKSTQKLPCIILMEDPELFLHPELQKTASEILYRLSRKNQVIFSTHSPIMIFNFNQKQIKQVRLDENGCPTIGTENDISKILNDLGYSANDLMNVGFVFIVEGKQDRNRLPLLLNKYYSEIYDETGNLQRIAIIATNSCTNIKTYANLKYINQLYLKDQFLMIRDGDGKDPDELKKGLCTYYYNRRKIDDVALPRVQEKNVLILKYYSFENYFLNPKVMAEIGVIKSEEAFYDILFGKYKEYLYRIKSFVKMREEHNIIIETKEDMKEHLEEILIYGRGHNLYDIFYGRYKEKEKEILTKYIEVAPPSVFADILDSIDQFIYFDSRKK